MREHGVLNRVLLIYEEGLRRLDAQQEISPQVFQHVANLVRKFVEDYHEKLEENFIFPEFEKRGKLPDLTKTLRAQHQAGRDVTDIVIRFSTGDQFSKADSQRQLAAAVRQFIRMYRPHEAREDTVLFPTFRKIVSAARIKELGEQFEKEEDRLFGDEGFEKTVDQVAATREAVGDLRAGPIHAQAAADLSHRSHNRLEKVIEIVVIAGDGAARPCCAARRRTARRLAARAFAVRFVAAGCISGRLVERRHRQFFFGGMV